MAPLRSHLASLSLREKAPGSSVNEAWLRKTGGTWSRWPGICEVNLVEICDGLQVVNRGSLHNRDIGKATALELKCCCPLWVKQTMHLYAPSPISPSFLVKNAILWKSRTCILNSWFCSQCGCSKHFLLFVLGISGEPADHHCVVRSLPLAKQSLKSHFKDIHWENTYNGHIQMDNCPKVCLQVTTLHWAFYGETMLYCWLPGSHTQKKS